MTFKELREKLIAHFNCMIENSDQLFVVDYDKDKLWDLYLSSFPKEKNPLFRERTEHDCSCCRHFIKTIGGVVVINNGEVVSVWDFDVDGDDTYEPSIRAMRDYVHSCPIADAFYTKEHQVGTKCNRELTLGKVFEYDHFYLSIPDKYIAHDVSAAKAQIRDTRNVFKRSLDELSAESINIVLELIAQGSLYRGEEHKYALEKFAGFKAVYDTLSDDLKELYAWECAADAGVSVGRIRNHSIGTLLVNISEGMELDAAVRRYKAIVAPTNYKRPKEEFNPHMLEEAKAAIAELGFMDSLRRRYATLDDITVNNILFSNRDAQRRIAGDDVFAQMAADVAIDPKKFNKVEEISIDSFIEKVLPTAKEIELLLENRLSANMVSLIAPEIKDSKTMFKWHNNFCWAYTGNIADSMKERVKEHGGSVTGDLRFSIQWNEDGVDNVDLDAHCITPYHNHIYYRSKRDSVTGGCLDVDIRCPGKNIAVENITWDSRNKMSDGVYVLFVHQFAGNLKKGFRAEVEFDGKIFSYDYPEYVKCDEKVMVAEVKLYRGEFSIKSLLPETNRILSHDVWSLSTNQFVPVTTIMYSPNFWDEQDGIGNKHYFFMLKDCVNPEQPNGFYNEYLSSELDKHKRVMAALGTKLAVASADDQLSGVGFSSTIRNSVVVKVKGSTERVLRIKF